MNIDKLNRGNALNNKIKDFEKALECFEYVPRYDDQSENTTEPVSLNPNLIIEFDDCDDGREQVKLPMVLSDCLVDILKTTIKEKIFSLKQEFLEL